MANLLAVRALALAVSDAKRPVRETPRWSNRGPEIDAYLEAAGEPLGQPYCCSAVYFWVGKAAQVAGVKNPLLKTGYCPYMATHLKSQGLARPNNRDAKPGDVILFWIPSEKRYGHAGLVFENLGGGVVKTVEANTIGANADVDSAHQNDGDGVYIKTRSLQAADGHADLVGDLQHFVIPSPPDSVPHPAPKPDTSPKPEPAAKPAPAHPGLEVRVDGVVYPNVAVLSSGGSTLVGLRGLNDLALKGRGVASLGLSADGRFLDVATVKPVGSQGDANG